MAASTPPAKSSPPAPNPATAGQTGAGPSGEADDQASGQGAVTGATIDETPQLHPEHSLWQHPFVQNVLPFLMSLSLHAGLILAAWLTLKAYDVVVRVVTEQIIIPEAMIVEGAPVGGIKNPGLGGDPDRRAEQDQFMNVPLDSQGWAPKPSETLTSILGGGSGGDESGVIGIGMGGFGSGEGVGTGRGVGLGAGTGDGGGALAPFGVPGGGGGLGPRADFAGGSGNARRITYVCDASGSMMNKFDSLRVEIQRSIDGLKPIQSFSIIFFQEEQAAVSDKSLAVANPANKRKAYDFLDRTSAHGTTDPIPALKVAFDQQPQLIYLLTDGDFPDNAAVEKYIAERNADKKVKINTIAFISPDEEYRKVLQRIADQNGGRFNFFSDRAAGR